MKNKHCKNVKYTTIQKYGVSTIETLFFLKKSHYGWSKIQ